MNMTLQKYDNVLVPMFESEAMKMYIYSRKNLPEIADAIAEISGMVQTVKRLKDLTPIVNRINQLLERCGDGLSVHPHEIAILMYSLLVMFAFQANNRGREATAFAHDIINRGLNLHLTTIILQSFIQNQIKLRLEQ